MNKEPLEKKYQQYYQIEAKQIKKSEYLIYFDVLKNHSFDLKKTTFVFDVDHTLLNINQLKTTFNDAFAKYNQVFSPSVWSDTYESAKLKENFYDFPEHIAELSKKIDGKKETKEALVNLVQETLLDIIPEIIHPNLFWQIDSQKEHTNLVIATSGQSLFQRMKICALLSYLPTLPQVVIYIEKTSKGDAINELYKQFNLPDNHQVYLFDDNPSELEDVHQKCSDKNIKLIRVRQPNGHYNNKIISPLTISEEWDFSNK